MKYCSAGLDSRFPGSWLTVWGEIAERILKQGSFNPASVLSALILVRQRAWVIYGVWEVCVLCRALGSRLQGLEPLNSSGGVWGLVFRIPG